MNNKFEKPELIVINFTNEDIITNSSNGAFGNPDCNPIFDVNCD